MTALQFSPFLLYFDHILWITDCGDELSEIAQNATETDCNIPCPGDSTVMCGANNPPRLDLYWNASAPTPPSPNISAVSYTEPWNYLGCYKYAYFPEAVL
jgi:hypothetical protein